MIRIKIPTLVCAIGATLAIALGAVLDASSAIGAQALHHLAFIGAGVFLGLAIRRSR